MARKPITGPTEYPHASIGDYAIVRRISAVEDTRNVYEATSVADGRRVALNLVPIDDQPQELVDEWLRDVETQESIAHRNVAAVYGAAIGGSWFYVVAELVPGPTLHTLTSAAALPVDRVVSLARDVAAGLDAVHEAGSLHRDLRPETIVVDPAGRAVLSDLGVGARAVGEKGAVVTNPYAAPESFAGAPLEPAANVYSLAAIVCEAVTGRIPRPADGLVVTSSVPEPLVVQRAFADALSLDPQGRPPTGTAFIEQVASAYGIAAARPAGTRSTSAHDSGRRNDGTSDSWRRPAVKAAVLAAVAIAVGLAFAAGRQFGADDAPPPPRAGALAATTAGIGASLPADWHRVRTPRQLARLVPDASSWQPLGLPGVTLIAGDLEPKDVGRLLAQMRLDPPSGEPMTSGTTQARRYTGQLARSPDLSATVVLLPTAIGRSGAACIASAAASESSTRTCDHVLRTVQPLRPSSAPASPDSKQITALATAMRRLNDGRRRDGGALERARTSGRQAAAARALGTSYATAEKAAAAISYTPLATYSGTSLIRALQAGDHAYRALGTAASDHSPTRYSASRRAVIAADGAIDRALRELGVLGYQR